MPNDIDVSPAQRSDVGQMSAVLARAFYDDPVMTWMLPDDRSRLKAVTRAFAGLARHHFLSRGGAEVGRRDGAVGAATLWDPPGQRKSSRLEELHHDARPCCGRFGLESRPVCR